MKIIKRLKAYKDEEIEDSIFGLGLIKAMDYDTGKKGHLVLFSFNAKHISFIRKIFIRL